MDIVNKVVDNIESFIEELRKEYEGLGLTDNQIIQFKNLRISCSQVKVIKESLFKFENDFDKILEIMSSFTVGMELPDLSELKRIGTIKRNKKGKQIKAWEKINFYK